MLTARRVFLEARNFGLSHKPLWAIGAMVLFHAFFDGITAYTVPIAMIDAGFTTAQMGLIYSTSSVFGAFFDIVLSKFMGHSGFRRLYLLMFIVSIAYPLVLYSASGVGLFLLAMGLWGLYYDLLNFGHYDYIGRHVPKNEHSASFGVLDVFKAAGLLLAPPIASLIIANSGIAAAGPVALAFLAASFVFFSLLLFWTRKFRLPKLNFRPGGLIGELQLWYKIGRVILPVLICFIFLNMFDAFFYTLGPLVSEEITLTNPIGRTLLTFYFLPMFIFGWFVGNLTGRFGKKTTAFLAMFMGSSLLITISLTSNVYAILAIVFGAAAAMSIAWPAIRGTIADYVSESPRLESEIEGVGDFSGNVGYVIGPALAGILAYNFGNLESFSVLGVIGVILSLILFKFTPKRINLSKVV